MYTIVRLVYTTLDDSAVRVDGLGLPMVKFYNRPWLMRIHGRECLLLRQLMGRLAWNRRCMVIACPTRFLQTFKSWFALLETNYRTS